MTGQQIVATTPSQQQSVYCKINHKTNVVNFLDYWLERVIKNTIRYSTWQAYRGYIDNHIIRFLNEITLAEVKLPYIQEMVADLSNERQLGSRTIGIIVRMMRAAFDYAEECEIIIKNPCRRVRLPKVIEDEVETFDTKEQAKIEQKIVMLGESDSRYYGILIALYTGLRVGELCALRWSDVDFANKTLKVSAALCRVANDKKDCKHKTAVKECEPKTQKSKRVIYLPDFIMRTLKQLKADSDSDYVLSSKKGKFVDIRTMQLLYKKLLKAANVRYIKFHGIRHTYASRATQLGVDPKTISDTLGHSNTQITLNRYTHSQIEQKQRMSSSFDAYYNHKKIPIKNNKKGDFFRPPTIRLFT